MGAGNSGAGAGKRLKSVLFIFGTRPEAIKLCPLIRQMRDAPGVRVRVSVLASTPGACGARLSLSASTTTRTRTATRTCREDDSSRKIALLLA